MVTNHCHKARNFMLATIQSVYSQCRSKLELCVVRYVFYI